MRKLDFNNISSLTKDIDPQMTLSFYFGFEKYDTLEESKQKVFEELCSIDGDSSWHEWIDNLLDLGKFKLVKQIYLYVVLLSIEKPIKRTNTYRGKPIYINHFNS